MTHFKIQFLKVLTDLNFSCDESQDLAKEMSFSLLFMTRKSSTSNDKGLLGKYAAIFNVRKEAKSWPYVSFVRLGIISIMLEVFIRKSVLTLMIRARNPTADRKVTYK